MEPVSTSLAKPVFLFMGNILKEKIMVRWSKYRADRFIAGFLEAIRNEDVAGQPNEELTVYLEKISDDQEKSGLLSDSFRRSCLSSSRDFGPRIIGLLTGRLLVDEKQASDADERIFAAAERLTDGEFRAFRDYISVQLATAGNETGKSKEAEILGRSLRITLDSQKIDSNYRTEATVPVSPVNLANFLGMWARKLEDIGIFEIEVLERQVNYDADSERYVDEPGSVRIISSVLVFNLEDLALINLIDRAIAVEIPQNTLG